MVIGRVVSFGPNKLIRRYLEKIKADLKIDSTSLLMNKIVGDYFLMQYGDDERKAVRAAVLEEHFKDY